MEKRGILFSTDALIALIIIFMTILIAYPLIIYSHKNIEIQSDVLLVLSSLKIGEIENSYVQELISQGKITDLNKTVLEQIGEFYVTDLEASKALADSVLENLDTNQNIGLWYGNKLISSKNKTDIESAKNIETSRQIISGINEGAGVTGYSSRAYLSSSIQTKYFYFGGYVGDGNISANIDYMGELKNINLEIAINKDFNIYINNIFSGHYEASPSSFIPAIYNLESYLSNFNQGINIIKLAGNNLYVAGGFVKIFYNDSQYQPSERYYFPGIQGIINLYDGFYVPGSLNNLKISLHFNNPYETFLTIGNKIIFNGSTSGEQTIVLTNSQLSSLLNYNDLSEKTTPIRLGVENVSYVSNLTKPADVFSVTDLSGSMCGTCSGSSFWCCLLRGGCSNNQENCEYCSGTCENKINNAKQANKEFIDSVLNYSGNRVGLIGYQTNAYDADYHALSTNTVSLKDKVDNWKAVGSTCICCGINKATNNLLLYSSSDKFRSMVVMSDGEANVRCSEQGTGDAKQDAIKAACDAYNNYNITVYAIGFGDDADETTMQSIADCGHGTYYYSSVDEISEIYRRVVQEIIEAAYKEQTIEVIGTAYSELYPDSYIEFNYTKHETPYGITITAEKLFDNQYSGSFSLVQDSKLLEAKVISYSGSRWTDNVKINNISIYKLSDYGNDYTRLGDPYAISIPNNTIQQNNIIELTTGNSPQNSTYGSINNKIIYTLLKDISAYSKISAVANGCIWNIDFEDNTNTTTSIPSSYQGTEICYYTKDKQEYNSNDAIQSAVYNLLKILDLDSDYKIEIKFTNQNLKISSSEVTGIPYTWSTEVQVRIWD